MPRFRFRTIPFIAAVALTVLGIALGNWQTRRAGEKLALQARLQQRAAQPPLTLTSMLTPMPGGQGVDPAAAEFRRVALTGSYVPDWTVFLDNRSHGGRAGFIVVTPLRLAGSDKVVLVERGWVAGNAGAHDRIPVVPAPPGERSVEGIAVLRAARAMELGQAPPLRPNAFVQNLAPAAFARATGLDVLPVMIEQTNADAGDAALVRDWPAPAVDVDRHRGYAFQWYALAAMASLFFVITGFRRASKQPR
jgi:surfeit locus 1 family protein